MTTDAVAESEVDDAAARSAAIAELTALEARRAELREDLESHLCPGVILLALTQLSDVEDRAREDTDMDEHIREAVIQNSRAARAQVRELRYREVDNVTDVVVTIIDQFHN